MPILCWAWSRTRDLDAGLGSASWLTSLIAASARNLAYYWCLGVAGLGASLAVGHEPNPIEIPSSHIPGHMCSRSAKPSLACALELSLTAS
jgi:hypothetical protein